MATFIVSALGGNWSSTTTWVGGVLPAVGDDIVANVTSGSLTVDSNRTCLTINFTNYTNTFTINNGFTLNITGTTITLGSGMTFATGTTGVLSTSTNTAAAVAIAFNGITIPRLTIGKLTFPNTQTITISGATPTVQNLICQSGVLVTVTLAGVNLIVTTSLSIPVNNVLAGLPLTITGTCTINTVGNLNTGFTVSAGSTVVLANTLNLGGGTITFPIGSFLSNPSNYFLSNNSSGIILNTSPVTWYGFIQTVQGTTFITSDLNIGAGGINISQIISPIIFNGAFAVNVNGSVVVNTISLTSATLNLTGSGTLNLFGFSGSNNIVNIATGASYAIVSSSLSLNLIIFNLVGTATCSVPAIHTLTLTSSTLTTNNTSTGANIVGGSEIQWKNISIVFTNTITYTTTVLGNLAGANATVSAINTGKMLVYGNLSIIAGGIFSGTSTIEFTGSVAASWGTGAYQNNIIVSKSGGAVVTAASAITWGFTSRTLTLNSTVNFSTNSNTFTLNSTPLTINNSSVSQFFNITVPNNGVLNINNNTTPILGTLSLAGSATFAGTYGWTCGTLSLTAAGTFTITLQNSVTYTTTISAILTGGTNAARYTMTSNDATIRAIWTLSNGASQLLTYVNGTRIDSSLGQTVYSFGGTLTDTINWLLLTTPGTVAYTFVN